VDWLNYHQLLNFWMVAREGSVQRASELLHVTPASVSIQVKHLERSLGVKLLEKRGRGLAVTEMGEQVAEYATEIFATGRELMELVKGRPVGRPMEFRVGVRDLMPKLVALQLLQPALEIETPVRLVCIEGNLPELVAELAIHKLDVVLSDTVLDPMYRVQAYSHRLAESDVVVVANAELAQRYRPGFPESLQNAPFLLLTDNSAMRRALDQWFHDRHITPFVRGEFADSAMMKIAGRQGMGLLAIPASILDDVRSIYGLCLVGPVTGVTETYYAVSVERRSKHPALIAMRERRSQFDRA